MDRFGVECADGNNLFDFDHAYFATSRGGQIEIARCLAENQVAALIRLPRLHDGEVSKNAPFQNIVLTVKVLHFLAISHLCADAGFGVKSGDACAPCPHPFSQCPLRAEFDFQFSGQILPFKFLIFPNIAGDHLFDLAGAEQFAQPLTVNPCIVAGDRQVLDARRDNRIDQPFRDTT